MHSGFVAGWSGVMLSYELLLWDPTDPVYNPIWRQGEYVMPFISRIGAISSLYTWSLGIKVSHNLYWTYETIGQLHILLSGSFLLAAFWHWAYWDLALFGSFMSYQFVLDLNQIIGIHLLLASVLCFGFGLAHVSGFLGPGMWTSDSFGLVGSIRFVKPAFNLIGLNTTNIGISHQDLHFCYSIAPVSVFLTAFVISALMWYGSSHTIYSMVHLDITGIMLIFLLI